MRRKLGVDLSWWTGRSSKPRWRRLRWLRWVRFPHAPATLSLLAFLLSSAPLAAQDTTRARPDSEPRAPVDTTITADTTRAPTDTTPAKATADTTGRAQHKPAGALWRSLVLPGWGQARLGRKLTAGLFIAAEGALLGLSLKANSDLHYLRRIGADTATVNAKSQDREDWLVLLAVNHLVAGLEAFVAANLCDFPAELKVEQIHRGIGASISLPVRLP